uniref:PDZ domain-containing protein n=1 Tax=Hanusia phi TaxID=3032 RepID=A0A7S0ECT4_9CRYP|mmetsp:Transcript_20681/g.46804  ORF Transcript_20681/g.46804 Transcript_20681/m.46804 type:complete len:180 (+) Transcript_20681:62-601(+)
MGAAQGAFNRRSDRGGVDVFLGLRRQTREKVPDLFGCGIVWRLDKNGCMVVRGVVPNSPAIVSTPSILVGDILLSIDGVEVPEALDQSQVAQVAQSFLGPENSTVMLGLCRPLKIPIDPSQLEVLTEANADYFLGILGDVTCATFHVEITRFAYKQESNWVDYMSSGQMGIDEDSLILF